MNNTTVIYSHRGLNRRDAGQWWLTFRVMWLSIACKYRISRLES